MQRWPWKSLPRPPATPPRSLDRLLCRLLPASYVLLSPGYLLTAQSMRHSLAAQLRILSVHTARDACCIRSITRSPLTQIFDLQDRLQTAAYKKRKKEKKKKNLTSIEFLLSATNSTTAPILPSPPPTPPPTPRPFCRCIVVMTTASGGVGRWLARDVLCGGEGV